MNELELNRLIERGESQRLEFEESTKAALREAVCALANDLEGSSETGYLLVGISDAGHFCGLEVNDTLLQTLARIRADGALQPLPSISVERVDVGKDSCAVVFVRPCDDPLVPYRGRVWVRVGSTTQIASAQHERVLVERRRQTNAPYDHRVLESATIDDLALEFFSKSYLPAAYAPEVLQTNGRTIFEQLEALRFVSKNLPTVGGMLVSGADPQRFVPGAYVQFVIFAGNDVTSGIMDEKVSSGRIDAIASATIELLRLTLAVSLRQLEGERDVKLPRYPLVALTKIAITH